MFRIRSSWKSLGWAELSDEPLFMCAVGMADTLEWLAYLSCQQSYIFRCWSWEKGCWVVKSGHTFPQGSPPGHPVCIYLFPHFQPTNSFAGKLQGLETFKMNSGIIVCVLGAVLVQLNTGLMPLGYTVVWQSPDALLCYRWLTVECGSKDLSDYYQKQKLCPPKDINYTL